MDAIVVAQYVFVVAFLSAFASGLLIFGFIVVQFLITPLVHLCGWKSFGEIQRPNEVKIEDQHKEHKRIALDFIVADRIKRERAARDRLHVLTHNPDLNIGVTKGFGSMTPEKTLFATRHGISLPHRSLGYKPEELWTLAKIQDGRAHVLCMKKPTANGLRTAWANLPDRACKMSKEAAIRWLGVIGEGAVLWPANSAARLAHQKELDSIANNIRSDREAMNATA